MALPATVSTATTSARSLSKPAVSAACTAAAAPKHATTAAVQCSSILGSGTDALQQQSDSGRATAFAAAGATATTASAQHVALAGPDGPHEYDKRSGSQRRPVLKSATATASEPSTGRGRIAGTGIRGRRQRGRTLRIRSSHADANGIDADRPAGRSAAEQSARPTGHIPLSAAIPFVAQRLDDSGGGDCDGQQHDAGGDYDVQLQQQQQQRPRLRFGHVEEERSADVTLRTH